MGYGNTKIKLTFPELQSSDDDPVWLVLRNPQLVPADEFERMSDGGDDQAAQSRAGNELIAKLTVAWRVYDATVERRYDDDGEEIIEPETDPQLLPFPATAELVAKLPLAIKLRLSEELDKANPQRTPESGGATGSGS